MSKYFGVFFSKCLSQLWSKVTKQSLALEAAQLSAWILRRKKISIIRKHDGCQDVFNEIPNNKTRDACLVLPVTSLESVTPLESLESLQRRRWTAFALMKFREMKGNFRTTLLYRRMDDDFSLSRYHHQHGPLEMSGKCGKRKTTPS